MRTALLDINVLLALVDSDHVNHDQAHDWAAVSQRRLSRREVREG